MRLDLQFCAPAVAFIIIVMMFASNVIATTPFIRCPTSTIPSKAVATPMIPMATATARIVAPSPLMFEPAIFVAAMRPTIIAEKAATANTPFVNDMMSNSPRILVVMAISNIADEIAIIVEPIFAVSLLAIFVIAIKPAIIPLNKTIKTVPFTSAAVSMPPIILATIARSNMDTDILRIVEPMLFTLSPANLLTAISPAISPPNTAIPMVPFINVATSNLAICLATKTSSSMAMDIFRIEPPTPVISVLTYCISFMNPSTNAPRAMTTPVPFARSPRLTPSSFLTAKAKSSRASVMGIICDTMVFICMPDLSMLNVPFSFNLDTTMAKPTNIADNAAIAPTAPHN